MDGHNALKREQDHVVDINDVGVIGCEEDTNDGSVSSSNNKGSKRMLAKLKSGALSFNGATKGECSINHNNLGNSKTELLIDNKNSGGGQSGEDLPLLEKKNVKEKSKTSCKKASKPPRPPKGPSLYTTDLILLREMSELAMKKRARIEHMKSLKRKRALKSSSSSSSSSVSAMVVTLLFCLIIVFQGICSRSDTTKNFEGSPEPAAAAAAAENELISVQFYNTQPSSDNSGPSSMSANFIENVPGSESRSPG